ncbi:MAG: type III-A CRISPR-associated protein Cas10/Csm1 [Candidatus Cloacimonas sp. 4484_275]|nr:MAG: type III-A CRISPR-associated protein Cas10/Csm1 [Candidatus Cloacimonas sp. 4484_275]
MKINVNDIVISSLLHDVGKIMQRAELSNLQDNYYDYCPNQGKTHIHAAWTAKFLNENPLKRDGKIYENWQSIANLAASHHKPEQVANDEEKQFEMCIVLADRISAKWDRGAEDKDKTSQIYKKRLLTPIFEKIHLAKHSQTEHFNIPLIKKSEFKKKMLQGNFYDNFNETDLKTNDYANLFRDFKKEYDNLRNFYENHNITLVQFTDALDSLLEEYLWCVPANTKEKYPSNSLYYHSRITASIAAVLFEYFQTSDKSKLTLELINDKEKRFILLGGDLSGIQNYITNYSPDQSKFLSKTLRARSFKVKIVSEMAIHYILSELNIPKQVVLMNAGGKFMILLPNKEEIKSNLLKIKKQIDKEFFQHFSGLLSLNLNWDTQISFSELNMANLKETLSDFFDNLELEKKKKFFSYLFDNKWQTSAFLNSTENLSSENLCDICHRHNAIDTIDENKVCSYCKTDIELGKVLPRKGVGIFCKEKNDKTLITLFDGKLNFELSDAPQHLRSDSFYFKINDKPDSSHIPALPVATFLPKFETGDNYILGNIENIHEPLSFDQISEFALTLLDDNKKKGTKMNALVKGDVDHLGLLFNLGLQNEQQQFSLTKYATFSAVTDFFFSTYIPALIENSFGKIYIIYAGGDDFALIGPWNHSLEFIMKLKKDFAEYVCNNPEIHFSVGYELMRPKAPLKHTFELAENALIQAKNAGRNRISIFGDLIEWNEMDKMMEFADQINDWLENSNITNVTSQFIYRLLQYHEMFLKFLQERKAEHLLYHAYLNYDLKRNIIKKADNDKITNEEIVKKIRDVFNSEKTLKNFKIALYKAIYENRKRRNDA